MCCRWLGWTVRSPASDLLTCVLTRDDSVRLFSTKSFKPLGTLKYHKDSCQALVFARPTPPGEEDDEDDEDDEYDEAQKEERSRWLVSASKDKLVSIWSLVSFDKK